MIEKILRWLGYVKVAELDVLKMECDGWKDAAQSWQRVAASRLKERSVAAADVYLGPRRARPKAWEEQEARVKH